MLILLREESIRIKKLNNSNSIYLTASDNINGLTEYLELSSSTSGYPYIQLLSNGSEWFTISESDNITVSAVAAANLIAWWKLDETSGTTATDSSNYGNNGTLTNGPLWMSGIKDNAVYFDGSNDYIEMTDASVWDFGTGDFTLSAWMKSTNSGWGWVLSRLNDATTGDLWRFGTKSDNTLIFKDTVAWQDVNSTASVNDGAWHHVAAVRSSGTVTLYIDGSSDGSGTADSDFSGTEKLRIGRWQGGSDFWDGLLDDVRIYNKALSANEVASIFGTATTQNHLVGWWKLDESSGTTASDSSGHENHGTLTDGPTWVSGTIDNAVSFDGTNDYIEINDSSAWDFHTNDFSVSAWIKTSDNSWGWILSRLNDAATGDLWRFGQNSDNTLIFRDTVAWQDTKSILQINDNTWHHVAAVRSSGNIFLYIDGMANGSNLGNSNFSGSGNLRMGRWQGGLDFWNGEIDDVRIYYNKALTASEVGALYGTTPWTPASISTLAWFDASDATTVTVDAGGNVSQWDDKSGNAKHATQTVSGEQPTYTSSTQIDGTTTKQLDLPSDIYSGQSAGTIVLVGKQTGTDGGWGKYGSNAAAVHTPHSSGFYDSFLATTRPNIGDYTNVLNNQVIYACINNGSSLSVYLDGSLLNGGGDSVTYDNTPSYYQFFNYGNYTLYEVVFLADDTHRQKVEGYLAHKWGIQGSLDAGHPYKSSAP